MTIGESISDVKSRLLSSFIKLYLIYKTKFVNLYIYYKTKYITNIDNIKGINAKDDAVNLMWRILLVSIITKAIGILNIIKRYVDIPCKIIESSNNYYSHVETVLYTAPEPESSIDKSRPNYVSLSKVLVPSLIYSHYEKKNKTRIFSLFKLGNECLKPYLIKYKDDEGIYNHTLSNILLINNIKAADDAMIELIYFEKIKKRRVQLPYHSVKDKHINYFYNSDFYDVMYSEPVTDISKVLESC